MPKIRIGLSTDFNLVGEQVGIGTTNPTARLDVAGQILVDNTAGGGGVSTFREYQGFHQIQSNITNNVLIDNGDCGPFSSLSGEIRITGETTVSSGSTVEVGKSKTLTVTDRFAVPLGDTNTRDSSPEAGTTRFNQDFGTLEFFDGANWKTVNSYARGGAAGRGVFGGGYRTPTDTADIESLNLSSGGTSVMFGDLTDERTQLGAASSSIRGLFAGGDPGPSNSDVIEYITIASGGNGIDFGNLISAGRLPAAASSSTRAIFAGEAASNVISYVEINTTGNALDFGDITTASGAKGTATSSPTRFVYASGNSPNPQIIEYGTISSKGNTLTFGDLTYGGSFRKPRATSNGIRGIFAGGYQNTSPYPGLKDICYITMATTGNAVNFGELTITRHSALCTSSQIKSIHAGGETDASGSGTLLSSIDTIDYASSGNAVEFGNLSEPTSNGDALSDSHGGLGGF